MFFIDVYYTDFFIFNLFCSLVYYLRELPTGVLPAGLRSASVVCSGHLPTGPVFLPLAHWLRAI